MSTLVNASRMSVEAAYLEARAARTAERVERADRAMRAAARSRSRSRERVEGGEGGEGARDDEGAMVLRNLALYVHHVSEAAVERESRLVQLRRESSHSAMVQYSVRSAVATFLLAVQRGIPPGSMFVQQYSITMPWYNGPDEVAARTGVIKLAIQHDIVDGLQKTLMVQQFMMHPMTRAVEMQALEDLLAAAFCTDSVITHVDICNGVHDNFEARMWGDWESVNDVRYDASARCYYVSRVAYEMPPAPPRLQRQNAMVGLPYDDAEVQADLV